MHVLRNAFVCLTIVLCVFGVSGGNSAVAQSVASGTVDGSVVDPTGAVISGAKVEIRNPITGYQQTTTTDSSGTFRFTNLPFNIYHIEVTQQGFSTAAQDVNVRTTVPISAKVMLSVAGITESVTVEAAGADIVENVPFAHADIDTSTFSKLPTLTPGAGLSDTIVMSVPGVVADSNGFFHPLGDHAQTSFQIDGQPINDQQSKVFSTQLPLNAIQSLELVSGMPSAEYGEKTSLIVNTTTRSGLGLTKPSGTFVTQYGSFGTIGEEASFGVGGPKVGHFVAANGSRSGHFLDTPEFQPIHDIGNNSSLFNRLDFQPNKTDAVHVNVFLARNWFQIPNSLDQLGQDQRQKAVTFNIAPGYQHTFNAHTLLTVNPYIRQDRVHYYPSAEDTPVTAAQDRRLTHFGVKADLSYYQGAHNLKFGTQLMATRLTEQFALGITDSDFNPVCLNRNGDPVAAPTVKDPANCSRNGFLPNPDVQLGLIPLDLTRGGSLFNFNSPGTIKEYSGYVQDSITWAGFTFNPGLRITRYDGLVQETGVQPRFGLSYLVKGSGTVLRAAYSRTFETPHNENLLLSSATGNAGLTDVFGALGEQPLRSGRRNQYNVGFQQAVGRFLQIDADYWWKFTKNAQEFDVILNTPITFPIMWQKDKLDGFGIRVSTTNLSGFQLNTTLGHGRLRYFGPEVGGLLFNSPVDATVFRTDSDDAFQQTTSVRYQWHRNGPWGALTWRYDSGQVAGVGSLQDVLGLTGAQQAAAGVSCGSQVATPDNPITKCLSGLATQRLRLPDADAANDDTNPGRVAPRHLFDIGFGTDNLFKREDSTRGVTLKFTILNATNKIAFYNFLSTFGGTHFVAPRTYQGAIGFVF